MYAEALLRIACLQASPAIAMKAEGKSEGELLWRIKRLLNHQQKRFNYSQQMIALVVTTCMLISIAWLQPAKTAKQPQQAAVTKPVKAVVVSPMAVQINNPFFNPFALLAKPLKEEVQKATQEITKTDLPKAIDTGLDEADKALTAVTPTVMDELDNLSIDSNFEQVTKEAQKELKKVKWNELKQLSPFVDSAFTANAVRLALDKNNLRVDFEKAKQSLTASQQQLVKLKQQNLESLINQSYLNAAINNATSWINSNDFIKTWNENRNAAVTSKKENKDQKIKQRQQALLLQRLLRNQPALPPARSFTFNVPDENDCYKKEDSTTQNAADQLANWSYTNPVYIEKAADAANGSNEDEDSVYSYTTLSQNLPAPPAAPAVRQMVRVVEVTDNAEHVSIIITVRQ